jgi:hypothetical protein
LSEAGVFVPQCPRNRLTHADGFDGEQALGRIIAHDGRMAQAVHQLATDAGVERRYQAQP